MKLSRLLFVSLLILPVSALAQEGVATFKYTMGANAKSTGGGLRLWFSPSAYRSEMEMNMGSTADSKSRRPAGAPASIKMTMLQKFSDPDKVYMINDETRTYSVMDQAKMRESNPDKETYTVKKLGSDRVAGFSCEKAQITSSSGSVMEVCVTNEVAGSSAWLSAMNRQQGRHGNWMKAVSDAGIKGGFPIRWTARAKDGSEAVMELVSLEKKPVPASMLQIPAGYRETSGGMVNMTPDQQKQMDDALSKLTPEQRKAYEDAMKAQQGKKQ